MDISETEKYKVKNSEQSFHINRRAFIIMPNGTGLVLGPQNADISHKQMFENLGFDATLVQHCLQTYPRGYFMNDELCIYQGCDMTPGKKWELTAQNYTVVQQYMPQLTDVFNLHNDTNLYLGGLVGDVGTIWKKINKTTIADFMRTR